MAGTPELSADAIDVCNLSAAALSAAYASRELTPLQVLAAIEQRIAALNSDVKGPGLNAIVTTNPALAADARASSERWAAGTPLSALDGVPVTVKDNIQVRGLACCWGSKLLADYIPDVDELPVARMRAAGMLILGKTNVPEFTLEGYTNNPLFGVTRNPWNPDLTPGGSSGGAVAAVAAGMGPLAIGTDGGGSIRRPASHTGLVGLKPSIGAVARCDGLPPILLDFEVIGPIARTVADTRLLFELIAGPDERDRKSLGAAQAAGESAAAGPETQKPLRILYVKDFGGNALDKEIDASVAGACETLRALGHRVSEGPLPFSLDFVNDFWPVLGQVGVASLFERYPQAAELASARFVDMAAAGAAVGAPAYLRALESIDQFRSDVTAAYGDIDIIMTPSAAALPWPAATPYPDHIDGREVGPRGHAIYTGWVNACGHPAINLPSAPSSAGLPIGFQLVGRFGSDRALLDLAEAFEARARAERGEPHWPA
ncbi:amidase [Marinobacterium sedimentorum]|uniref:amidase n=1 Tax=Marinobacterium sedimentorum TaxID=2927804 RepID=UPI0020C684BF|nr:amidase [Marinobacterium sedimentorum]MCP8688094.1 amidase [Marinobacterium sedimentorum]